jgi:hypothetical protein
MRKSLSKIATLLQQVEGVKNGFGEIRKVAQKQINSHHT